MTLISIESLQYRRCTVFDTIFVNNCYFNATHIYCFQEHVPSPFFWPRLLMLENTHSRLKILKDVRHCCYLCGCHADICWWTNISSTQIQIHVYIILIMIESNRWKTCEINECWNLWTDIKEEKLTTEAQITQLFKIQNPIPHSKT